MKNINKRFGFIAMIAVIGLSFTAPVHAGGIADRLFGGGAKNLAKQSSDLAKQAAELQQKAAEIEKKVINLSDRDRRTYQQELVRLGFEPPEGLFNDGQALLSGAREETQGAGGILGGLAGILGGRESGNSGTTATTPQATTPTTPSTPAAAGSNILGGRTGAFFNIFDGKNYHMKARTSFQGMEVVTDTYIKGDMIATVSDTMGMTTRSVQRDNMIYVIMDATRTVMAMPISASSGNPSEEPLRTTGMVVTGSGTARFDGRNLPYEEYSLAGDSSVKLQMFIDGNNLAGIRTITSGMTIDMVVLALDQNVPNSVFEIPAGYQRTQMP
jgi:hypothetical protein